MEIDALCFGVTAAVTGLLTWLQLDYCRRVRRRYDREELPLWREMRACETESQSQSEPQSQPEA